jgi:hypothetical protein
MDLTEKTAGIFSCSGRKTLIKNKTLQFKR